MTTVYYWKDSGKIQSVVDMAGRRGVLSQAQKEAGLVVAHFQENNFDHRWKYIIIGPDGHIQKADTLYTADGRVPSAFKHPYRLNEAGHQYIEPQSNQMRIGIFRFIGIGDVLMTMQVAVPSIRLAFPDAHITYYTSVAGERLIGNSPHIDKVVARNWEHGASPAVELPEIASECDLAINLVNRVDFLPVVLKCNRPDNFFDVMNAQLANLGHKKLRKRKAAHSISTSSESSEWLYEVFHLNHLSPPLIGCQLASRGKMKQLSVLQWTDLAIANQGYTFIWFADQSQFKDLSDLPSNVINTASILNFDEYLMLWYACDLTICTDSGGAHLSGTMNQPCLVLVGSTKYKDHFLNYESTIEVQAKKRHPCQPCIDWQIRSDCKDDSVAWCLRNITNLQITEGIKRCLESRT